MNLSAHHIFAIIPAFNEAASIGRVISEIPAGFCEQVIVVDNASTDGTAEAAGKAGALVLKEEEMGYGAACLKGIAHVNSRGLDASHTVIVFLDGDHSDYPAQMVDVAGPVIDGTADMVIGSRALGQAAKGSLTPQQVYGNRLATFLIRKLYGFRYTDLGPFRAIRLDALNELQMRDRNYGWTVEMQLKALQNGLKVAEVPVDYRKRIGTSKVSGTVKGTILAGYKIISTILRHSLMRPRPGRQA